MTVHLVPDRMAKRAVVVLSGCGSGDGSDVREAVLAHLSLERAGASVTFAAPDVEQAAVVDHSRGAAAIGALPRRVLDEAARLGRGPVRTLASIAMTDFDVLIFPGGKGVATVLSNYAEKGERCDVLPDVARLLKDALARHRPIGLIGLAPILAARVLGPVAGVHLTLGARGTAAYKHASVMGADVRPCPPTEVFVDRKNRVISTPLSIDEEVRVPEAAQAIERLVRAALQLTNAGRPVFNAQERGTGQAAPHVQPGRMGAVSPVAPSASVPSGAPVLRRPGGRRSFAGAGPSSRGPGSA